MTERIIKCQFCDGEFPELTYYSKHIVGNECTKNMVFEKLNMCIVSEGWHGDKHSIHLSNTPDFDDQHCEVVVLLRPKMKIVEMKNV